MSFQSPNAYLPKDLLDSDDDVAADTLGMKSYIINNILDDSDEEKTADNSANSGNNSGCEIAEANSLFSTSPFKQNVEQPEDPVVGWTCSACQNSNSHSRIVCFRCQKERTEADKDVTKSERK